MGLPRHSAPPASISVPPFKAHAESRQPVDATTYRTVMGLWPTGVAVVSGRNAAGEDFGMVIGSFTSVSLDPPLVAFCPQKASASWQAMRQGQYLCINLLSEFQSDICWKFSSGDIRGRFTNVAIDRSHAAVARIEACCAWIDVQVEREIEAGDHWLVLCRVQVLHKGNNELPMSFVKGKLSKTSPIPGDDRLGEWERSLNMLFTS